MNRLLIIGILLVSMVPFYAQGQQPNTAKLKEDAQKVVSIISGDKAKTQTYCQIADLGEQIDREKDSKKAEALFQKMNELDKQLGPEYLAFVEATKTWIQIPRTVRISCRCSMSSMSPVRINSYSCCLNKHRRRDARAARAVSGQLIRVGNFALAVRAGTAR